MITIYTDGASRGNPGPGGWGTIISYQQTADSRQEEYVVELGGSEQHTTNNRMELTAAIRALEFVSKLAIDDCALFTDSEYVMKGITEWIEGWQKRGWKTANRKPVLNQDLWQRLLDLSRDKKIEWRYVAGHSGVPLNERADQIATACADGLHPALYHGPKNKYK